MNKLKLWYTSHSEITHYLAMGIVFLFGAYYQVPQFHDLVTQVYMHLPNWVKQIVVTGIALYGWYRKSQPQV